jgi:hypothetical protein
MIGVMEWWILDARLMSSRKKNLSVKPDPHLSYGLAHCHHCSFKQITDDLSSVCLMRGGLAGPFAKF